MLGPKDAGDTGASLDIIRSEIGVLQTPQMSFSVISDFHGRDEKFFSRVRPPTLQILSFYKYFSRKSSAQSFRSRMRNQISKRNIGRKKIFVSVQVQ